MYILDLFYSSKGSFFTFNTFGIIRIFIFTIISIISVIQDIKSRKVYSLLLIIISSIMLISWFFVDIKLFFNCLIGCLFFIIIYLLIFFISKGGIGLGDMFYLCFFCSLYGFFYSIIAFVLSFWTATIVLIIPYLFKKIDRKTKIPLIPFIFSGCLILFLTLYIIN